MGVTNRSVGEGLLTGTEMTQASSAVASSKSLTQGVWWLMKSHHALEASASLAGNMTDWSTWAGQTTTPRCVFLSRGTEAFQDSPSFHFPWHVSGLCLLHEHPCWSQGIFSLEHNRYWSPTHVRLSSYSACHLMIRTLFQKTYECSGTLEKINFHEWWDEMRPQELLGMAEGGFCWVLWRHTCWLG